ncbi:NUDIX domain-containing protein [Streptomyces sp. PvR034]|uniref:NUDIX domain-containing protein n=1 Tax=Streptomyces sp. PvR034 TaxID=3156401 RepID=UPI00339707AE
MARTEYYDDPHAPEPNSLVVAASAVVTDDRGRILLQRRRDNDLWALPGGALAVHHTQRLRLGHFLEHRSAPYPG